MVSLTRITLNIINTKANKLLFSPYYYWSVGVVETQKQSCVSLHTHSKGLLGKALRLFTILWDSVI